MPKFDIGVPVLHGPTQIRGRVIGLFTDRFRCELAEVEYRSLVGTICSNYLPIDELLVLGVGDNVEPPATGCTPVNPNL